MLYSIDDIEQSDIPQRRRADFALWRGKLSDEEYNRAIQGIRLRCNGKEFVVSSFLPGSDWTNNEFHPLYIACGKNAQHAGWFFGLIVWQAMINDKDHKWRFLPTDKDDTNVLGMRYFLAK